MRKIMWIGFGVSGFVFAASTVTLLVLYIGKLYKKIHSLHKAKTAV